MHAAKVSGCRQVAQPTLDLDETDAARVIEAAMIVATLPTIMSPRARELVAVSLRGLQARNSGAPEIIQAILQHVQEAT